MAEAEAAEVGDSGDHSGGEHEDREKPKDSDVSEPNGEKTVESIGRNTELSNNINFKYTVAFRIDLTCCSRSIDISKVCGLRGAGSHGPYHQLWRGTLQNQTV